MPNKADVLKTLSEAAARLKTATPEEYDKAVAELAKLLPSAFVEDALKDKLAQDATRYDSGGYAAFYKLLYGFDPPEHVKLEIKKIFYGHQEGMGAIIFASRGFWKTVSISVTFTAWRIGLDPKLTHLIIGANDDSAEKITKSIADIIELHPEFKRAFPNVVPNKGRWSTEGFSVIDTSIQPEEWARLQAATIDPTFVGGGYTSSRLNGKHPTGNLIMDDIHDRGNSASERERKAVVETVTKTILKTAMREKDKLITQVINIATPWAMDDVNNVLKSTGEFVFVNIPAATRAVDGTPGAVYCDGLGRDGVVYEDIVGWWKLTWPDHYGLGSFKADRATLGKSAFWQMIMLDLATASTGRLTYFDYEVEDINVMWPMIGGVDPTTFEQAKEGNKNSHFAFAYIAKTPQGKAVVVDGILEQCTELQAENYILVAQKKYPNWQTTYVENLSVGKVFLQTLQRDQRLRVLPSGLKGITDGQIRSKQQRILTDMAKWFENGTVTISKAESPFLNALRRGFERFYDLDPKHSKEFDAMDAVYHALKNMPDILYTPDKDAFVQKKRKPYPLNGIGRSLGIS